MKWEKCSLIKSVSSENDELGNEILQDKHIKTVFGRFTPWDNTEIALEERMVTKNCRKVLIRCVRSDFPKCEKIKICGELYEITEITTLNRFTLLYVKKMKG